MLPRTTRLSNMMLLPYAPAGSSSRYCRGKKDEEDVLCMVSGPYMCGMYHLLQSLCTHMLHMFMYCGVCYCAQPQLCILDADDTNSVACLTCTVAMHMLPFAEMQTMPALTLPLLRCCTGFGSEAWLYSCCVCV